MQKNDKMVIIEMLSTENKICLLRFLICLRAFFNCGAVFREGGGEMNLSFSAQHVVFLFLAEYC